MGSDTSAGLLARLIEVAVLLPEVHQLRVLLGQLRVERLGIGTGRGAGRGAESSGAS